jgi:hypothetical protein
MRALVCGGRDYMDEKYLEQVLDLCLKWWNLELIITGEENKKKRNPDGTVVFRGADTLAHQWALKRRLATEVYLPDWDTYGKPAGMIRNRQMLVEGQPNVVIAFPGNVGTENMVTIARRADVPVFIPGKGQIP